MSRTADRQAERDRQQLIGREQLFAQPLEQPRRRVGIAVGQQHHELTSADPTGHVVEAAVVLQKAGYPAERRVSRQAPVVFVYYAQFEHIGDEQREALSRCSGDAVKLFGKPPVKDAPSAEPGEGIAVDRSELPSELGEAIPQLLG